MAIINGRVWSGLSLRAKGLIVALIPLMALLLACSMFYLANREEHQAQQWVTHSLEVRSKIQETQTHLEESETRLRGYFLSADKNFLRSSVAAQQFLTRSADAMQRLVQDNSAQSARAQRIADLAQRKIIQAQKAIALHPKLTSDPTLAVTIRESRAILEELRGELAEMRREEERLTLGRMARVEQARGLVNAVIIAGLLVGLGGGVAASFLFTKSIDSRLQRLNFAARALAQGQPLEVATVGGHDAISTLAAELEQTGQLIIERQNKLHEANDYLNHLVSSMPGVLVRLSKEFQILYVSPNAPRVFGYEVEEILADADFYSRTMHPEDRNGVMLDLTRAIIEKAPLVETERRMLNSNGQYHWMHSYVRPEYDEQGDIQTILSYSVDVTELKQTQQALRESESVLRNSFDFAPIGFSLLSLDGKWLKVNRAMCDILGYTETDFLQITLQDITHPEDFKASLEKLCGLLSAEIPFYEAERRYIHRDGHLVWVQLNVSLVRNNEGEPLYFIGQVQDISSRKIIEDELAMARDAALESARAKASFLANMSHEIRTPMNGIVGMVGLLSQTALAPQQREFVQTLHDSADALLAIINDILDFSKLEAEKMQLERTPFDLSATVEASIALLATKAQLRGLELGSLIYRDVPTLLCGDAGRLRQVLLNLVDNAVKFTPQSGDTMLRVTRKSEDETHVTLKFSISDSGIGIDEETQQRLFQPFAQADGSTTRRYGGTGLGLAICKQLVEMMEGEIGVDSRVGEGSTFWFTARFEKQSNPEAAAAREKADMSRCRVLVVENNAAHRHMVQQQVASWNFHCDSVPSGADAIEILHREFHNGNPYHFTIISRQLDDVGALDLAQSIRSEPSISSSRLIMMVLPDDDVEAIRVAGVDDVLTKPIRQSQLFNSLTEVMVSEKEEFVENTLDSTKNEGKSLRILVAEDNAINQKVVVNQLRNLGHSAVVVTTGTAAIREWQSDSYTLILMDCHMPDMDGYSAAREIRQLEAPGQHIPIIALTANALEGDRERCLKAGMDDYLSKPVKQNELAATLELWSQNLPSTDLENEATAIPNPEIPNTEIPDTEVLDVERWNELKSELSAQLLREVVEMFLFEMPQLLGELRIAWSAENAAEIGEIAHKMKGICATLGATRLVQACLILQKRAYENALHEIPACLARLEVEFGPAKEVLNFYIQNHLLQKEKSIES